MSRDDWFRNEEWNADIEAAFEARLRRARDKVQPLKIQAASLVQKHPDVALRLLDRYFATGDQTFLSSAFSIQAEARLAIGDVAGALKSHEMALAREAEWPHAKTNSFVDYPLLVAERRVSERYPDALRVLAERREDCAFPVQHFMWHAARALILSAQGAASEAAADARAAMAAAGRTESGVRHHQSLGLVDAGYDQLKQRLRLLLG